MVNANLYYFIKLIFLKNLFCVSLFYYIVFVKYLTLVFKIKYKCNVFYVLEMAEHHDAKTVLSLARNLVLQLQTLIENK